MLKRATAFHTPIQSKITQWLFSVALLLMFSTCVVSMQAKAQMIPTGAGGPSQAQLEQLRALPRAQQEQLARQFGIDLRMLDRMEQQDLRDTEVDRESVVFPRGTRFDEYGEPIMPEDLEREFSVDREEIKPFGYDMFASQPRTFAPLNHAPVPSNYIMGIGDSIIVQLFGNEPARHELTIDREGRLVIPNIGPVQVGGLTYSAMQELVRHTVRQRQIGLDVAVSMGDMRSIQIFVVGEAYQPGAYTVSSLSTLSQALYVSGGVSEIASLRNIQLVRGGEVVSNFDLYDLLLRGDASADRILQSGDVVFVPPRGDMITVKGAVNRVAKFELKGDETFADALMMAGGAKPEAFLESTQVRRVRSGRFTTESLNLTQSDGLARTVAGGDTINVSYGSEGVDESIVLIGAVSRPGSFQFREGMRINDIITDTRQDLLEQADFGYGLIVRERSSRRDLDVYQFDVALAVEGEPEENLTLQPRDQIVIFSRFQTREEELNTLSRVTLSREEREREAREELLREYRKAFLEDLVQEARGQDNAEIDDFAQRQRRQLFGSLDEETDELPSEAYADYSRERLLAPLNERLQRQRTERGNTPFVYVAGEVNHPGMYPLPVNASAKRLIAAAGGLTDAAFLSRAEITRVVIEEGIARTEYEVIDLMDVILGNDDVTVMGRDRLNVLAIPEWQNTYEVVLRGEVRFPGTYAIRRGESLSNLINRAGGLTDHAFIEGAVFTRQELREQERRRQAMLAQELQREIASNAITGTGGSTQSYTELRELLADLMAMQPVGRLIIDLPSVIAGSSAMGDIELKNGDELHIPSRLDSVSILGEVQMASSYRFDRQLSVRDYIDMSGGVKQKADTDRIYVVRANGAIESHRQRRGWFSSTGAVELRPGDSIVVPLDSTYRERLELWSQVTSIIYNSAVALAAINSI